MLRFFILIFIPALFSAQSFKGVLLKANSFYYKHHMHVYGLEQNKSGLHFKLYKISDAITKIDSNSFFLSKDKADEFLDIAADTLHGYLNFHFQKLNNKNQVTLLRLNDSLKLISKAENLDVTKINSITAFENEKYVFRNSMYIIRTSQDSGGKQFFLNKYDLSNFQKAFEYKQAWQFPFERRHISYAHVFYADSQIVLINAVIFEGTKKGQWVLKVNSGNGQLIKGYRVSVKDDPKSYLYSNYYYDKVTKEILMAGTVHSDAAINFPAKTFTFSGLAKSNILFFVSIDSLGENIIRNEKTLPIAITTATLPGKPAAKQTWFYQIKIKELQKKSPTDYLAYCDIYKSMGQNLSFLYETGFYLNISITEEGIELIPDKIYSNTSVLPGIVVTDPKDINGKFDLKGIEGFPQFLTGSPISDVEKCFGRDDQKNTKWILRKSDLKTSKTTFYSVNVGSKGLQSKMLLENDKYTYPSVYKINDQKLMLFNFDSGVFEVSLVGW